MLRMAVEAATLTLRGSGAGAQRQVSARAQKETVARHRWGGQRQGPAIVQPVPRDRSLTLLFLIAAAVGGSPAPAPAQTTALNPTTMTGYAGTAAADQQARRRSMASSSHRQAQACGNLPVYRKQYGSDNAQVVRLEALCGRAGYRVR